VKLKITLAAAAAAVTLAAGVSPAAAVRTPSDAAIGSMSLAEALAADGSEFDGKWRDFDVAEALIKLAIARKPDSALGVVADGTVRLTAFIPNDRAFRKFADELIGGDVPPATEADVYNALVFVFPDQLEAILLYHVVPGRTITAEKALQADGARLKTAQGRRFKVSVMDSRITLVDKEARVKDPRVVTVDINKGNRQIAHGINGVLRPDFTD
jgi:uncharacterized surface protein with fasciclin (FAS1) repeats